MSTTQLKQSYSVFYAIVAALLIAVILFSLLLQQVSDAQEQHGKRLIQQIEKTARASDQVFNLLHKRTWNGCSGKHLRFMQQVLYDTRAFKEIGFYSENQLICTTNLGALASPIELGEPDYYGNEGSAFYIQKQITLFDTPRLEFTQVWKNYHLVFDASPFEDLDLSPSVWEIVGTFKPELVHIFGQKKLFNQVKNQKRSILAIQYSGCSQLLDNNYCVAVSINGQGLIKKYSSHIVAIILLTVMFGVLFYNLHQNVIRKRSSLKYRIRDGLDKNRFYWLYQPIVVMDTGKIIGAEALARFEDSQGVIYPDQFLPVLKENNLTEIFTHKMLAATLNTAANLDFPMSFRFSFNFFPRDIVETESMMAFLDAPAVTQCNYKLVLEIVEDEHLDSDIAHKNLEIARQKGWTIAVDDFGTGYSNLSQLRGLEGELLKIDRSFIFDMEENSIRSSLIPHIVEIAENMDMEVVAEGVENIKQQQQLIKFKVRYGQGWLFGKPMTLKTLAYYSKNTKEIA